MLKSVLRSIFKFLFKVQINAFDLQSIAGSKKIIIANHQSFLDGIMIGLFVPLDMVFVVNTEIAKNFWYRQVLRLVNYFPVDPSNPMAMKQIVKLVNEGKTLVIFPEGRITVTGSLMKIFEGSAFVAAKTEAVIIPVSLKGLTFSHFSRVKHLFPTRLFPQVTLKIHKPQILTLPKHLKSKDQRKFAARKMRLMMQDIMFESIPRETLFTAFLDARELFGSGRKILEDKDLIEYSYNDILKRSIGLGLIVQKISKEKETIGVLLPNVIATAATILGMNMVNRVPAMLNFTVGKDGINSACAVAAIKTIITSRKFIEMAKLDFIEDVNAKVLYLEDLKDSLNFIDKLNIFAGLLFPYDLENNVDNKKTAYVLFTSGSEGTPKGVVLSQDNVLANVHQIKSVIDLNPKDKIFNALPMFHSFGLTAGTILPILTGTNVFLYPSPLHNRIIPQVIYDRDCTVLFGTSTFLKNYARFADEYDFRSLRYVVAGAEKLSVEVKNVWFEKFGIRIFEGYGTTELSPVVSVNTPTGYKAGSVGALLPGVEYILEPVEGIENGGLLHLRAPNLMLGYLKIDKPGVLQPPSSSVGEGWYDTGDIVTIDELGFVTITGRVKRFAKIAGEMISLEKVEALGRMALNTEEPVCLAVNLPDEQKGEMIVLFVLEDISKSELIKVAQENGIPLIAVPKHIFKSRQFPLLGTGKTDYTALKSTASILVGQANLACGIVDDHNLVRLCDNADFEIIVSALDEEDFR